MMNPSKKEERKAVARIALQLRKKESSIISNVQGKVESANSLPTLVIAV